MSVSIPSLPLASSLGRTDTVLAPERGTDGERVRVHQLGGQTHDLALTISNSNRTLTNGQVVELGLGNELQDSAGMFSGSSTTNRWTAPKTGVYRFELNFRINSVPANPDLPVILRNITSSTDVWAWFCNADTGGRVTQSISISLQVTAGTVLAWQIGNFTGADRTLVSGNCIGSMQFLHD